jgi:predicted phosphodiesterase
MTGIHVAALYDIHGNVAALTAVLAEIERESVEHVVIGGDVASGPFPAETIARLRAIDRPVSFVRGNGDRELVEAFDAGRRYVPRREPTWDDLAAWAVERLTSGDRDFLASFLPQVALEIEGLGTTLFCHATPRDDEQIVTSLTPEADLLEALGALTASAVVCGHTHAQYQRGAGGATVVNAGSVGMPYERAPGAYWALLGPGVRFRHTMYDVERAAAEIRGSGFPLAGFADENVVAVPSREDAESQFEALRRSRQAHR